MRRRMLMSIKKSILPKEYQEVEYLESTGQQWIDTGIKPIISDTQKPRIKINCKLNNPKIRSRIFGVLQSGQSDDRYFQLFNNIPQLGLQFFNPEPYTTFIQDDNWHNYDADVLNRIATQDTTSHVLRYINHTMYINLYLFARNNNGIADNFSDMRISYFYYNDGEQNIEFIPCYRKSDNKPGMYDIVSNQFFTNAGTGEFLVGRNIN